MMAGRELAHHSRLLREELGIARIVVRVLKSDMVVSMR